MAKKSKSKVSVGSYVFVGLMLAATIVGFVGLLVATHYSKADSYTLSQLGEMFTDLNKLTDKVSTAAFTMANIFGWVAVAGAVALVVLEALKLFGVKVPSIATWILVGVTLVSAAIFIVCASTVCVDICGSKDAYDLLVKSGAQLRLGAGSYMTVIGTALVPVLAVAKKLTVK